MTIDQILKKALYAHKNGDLKKAGEFLQGKYMAEDETFKFTNFVMELDRIIKANAKRAGVSVDDFRKGHD